METTNTLVLLTATYATTAITKEHLNGNNCNVAAPQYVAHCRKVCVSLHVKHTSTVVPVHAMRTYRKNWSIAPLTVNHGSEGLVSTMHLQVYPQKNSHYPLNKRLGGSQSWSGHSGEVKCLLDLPRFKPWTIQLVAQSLYWLYYPSSLHTTYIFCKVNYKHSNNAKLWGYWPI